MKIYVDGSCRPKNPGGEIGSSFFLVDKDGELITEDGIILTPWQYNTNIVAEALAMLMALKYISRTMHGFDYGSKVTIYSDLQFTVNIVNAGMRNHPSKLYEFLVNDCVRFIEKIKKRGLRVHIQWIPRKENKYADYLSRVRHFPGSDSKMYFKSRYKDFKTYEEADDIPELRQPRTGQNLPTPQQVDSESGEIDEFPYVDAILRWLR